MKSCFTLIAVTILICTAQLTLAAEKNSTAKNSSAKTAPVRMGCGVMTFDTVPGWGLSPEGKSVIGPTHGGVVVG